MMTDPVAKSTLAYPILMAASVLTGIVLARRTQQPLGLTGY